ncbi:MAG: glutamine-hydrolyzing carbamoyl-phosphate synthase small subunit [Acidimicrobiia bacterium]
MNGLLVTSDGAVFRGVSVGAPGIATGELVFNTAMTGYQEVLTDPSYAGQVVVMTASHIGNYGVNQFDSQSVRSAASGMVMRSIARHHSNWRAEDSFVALLVRHGVVAISEVDTRRLTRHLRDRGAMPVAIGSDATESELMARAEAAPRMEGQELATKVSTPVPYSVPASADRVGRVVAIDLGMKTDITRQLASRGLYVDVVPAATSAADILAMNPDGVFVSNGPGDPEPLLATTSTLKGLLGNIPVFGICLGHQVLGLALGATTFKLPFGHHGGNHPVRRLADGSVAITSQNHGFAVDLWSLSDGARPERSGLVDPGLLPGAVDTEFGRVRATHQNLNDGTLEGMACENVPAFSVQYHPEAAPGPRDAVGLFDQFMELMGLAELSPSVGGG